MPKPLNEYAIKRGTRDGRKAICKICTNKASRIHYEKNKGRILAKNKIYRQNHPDEFKIYGKRYRNKLGGEFKRRDIEYSHKYSAKKGGLVHDLTEPQWQETLKACNYRCIYCGKPWENKEHFIPVSKGGGYTVNNILPTCGSCNSKKNVKKPLDFIRELTLVTEANRVDPSR